MPAFKAIYAEVLNKSANFQIRDDTVKLFIQSTPLLTQSSYIR